MNFAGLKEYRKTLASDLKSVTDYLANELAFTIRELRAGLQKLSFKDNFDSFEAILTIPANTEQEIVNQLSSIPSYFLVLRTNKGGLSVCEGDTLWTLERLYLKNTSATDAASITVRFFK
jgi:hypothetical protein